MIPGAVRRVYKAVLRGVIYAVIRPLIALLQAVPPRAAGALGATLGAAASRLFVRDVRRAERNLARAFPDRPAGELRAIARRNFAHLGRVLAESLSLFSRPRLIEAIGRDVVGVEEVARTVSAGRPVVILTSHLGNWEVAAAAVGSRLPKLAVVARDLYDRRLTDLGIRLRERFNVSTFSTGDARGMLRHLKRGGVLGVLADQASRRVANVAVPFFGIPVETPAGPVRLALRTGARLMSGFATRREGGYALRIDDLPVPEEPGRRIEEAMATFNRRLEELVRAHPEQWIWIHDRFARYSAGPARP